MAVQLLGVLFFVFGFKSTAVVSLWFFDHFRDEGGISHGFRPYIPGNIAPKYDLIINKNF